jgi:hypothetical protein
MWGWPVLEVRKLLMMKEGMLPRRLTRGHQQATRPQKDSVSDAK